MTLSELYNNSDFEFDNGMLFNNDCLKIMKDIPDNSIDCVLCDLPYGTTKCSWDNIIPFDDLWNEYKRITKDNSAIILFGTEPFTSLLIQSNLKMYRQKLTWLKTRLTNVFNAKKTIYELDRRYCYFL